MAHNTEHGRLKESLTTLARAFEALALSSQQTCDAAEAFGEAAWIAMASAPELRVYRQLRSIGATHREAVEGIEAARRNMAMARGES